MGVTHKKMKKTDYFLQRLQPNAASFGFAAKAWKRDTAKTEDGNLTKHNEK
jgi:hypothetical protein